MHKSILRVVRWGLGVGIILSGMAHAASFDCAKAQTQVEKMICADVELSKLDEALAVAYVKAVKVVDGAVSIRQEQKQWLKVRNSCKSADCLFSAYEKRVPSLLNDAQRHLRYRLVHGLPYEPLSEVCQPFTDMLNASDPKEPLMQCEQKIHADYSQFQRIAMQALSSADNFKYFSAIRDYEVRLSIDDGGKPHRDEYNKRQELFEQDGGITGYKYYLLTTDRFIENKTITLLIREKQSDCRKDKFNLQRTAYEWDANTEKVITERFSFQSLYVYEGQSMQGPGLLYSYHGGDVIANKHKNKFSSIWIRQADGSGASGHICTIVFINNH